VDVLVKCPNCGDQAMLDSSRLDSEFICPGCHESFVIRETEPVVPSANPRKTHLADGRLTVPIGFCAGRGEAAVHVEKLLMAEGIQPFLHGSRVYAIEVLESDVGRARASLLADPEKDRYEIKLYPT
jgi:predicted RNA-binding Zn-ribbon protein involved in translation (DUF1610 family)